MTGNEFLDNLKKSLRLGLTLGLRNVQARYRGSFLGLVWSIVPSFLVAIGFALAHSSDVIEGNKSALPFFVVAFIGTNIWQILVEFLNAPLNAIQSSKTLLQKVAFPREAIVIAQAMELWFMASFRLMTVWLAILFFSADMFSLKTILLAWPFFWASVFGLSLGLMIVPILTLFQDVSHIFRIFTTYGIFLTPVIAPSKGSILSYFVELNPATWYIFQAMTLAEGVSAVSLPQVFLLSLAPLILLMIGVVIFRISAPHLIERLT